MEFRILGPLQVVAAGEELPLRGAKQRALLALLLLDAGHVVSTDRLIDELWHDSPPPTAQTALHGYVLQLRRLLEPEHVPSSPYERLVTHPAGYELRIRPDELDLGRFERLDGEARAALADGHPERAAQQLREALALWRGPPLADVAYESFAQPRIAELVELRLAALEDRFEADLALGRHGDIVGELETLVADNPLRESLRLQLMLALYRSGRQAEALEIYAAGRRMLIDELGIEPGPALHELERAILNHDPSLAAPRPTASVATRVPVPANPLLGRERELASVCDLLRREEVRLVTLTGVGGSGKSRLALEAAHTLSPEFDRGAVLVALAPIGDPAITLPTVAQALSIKEATGETLLETLARSLAEQELLIVLDNFEHVVEAAPAVAALLAATPGLKVLATSRTPLHVLGERELTVPPLALPEAGRLSDPDAVLASPAARLFVERARAIKSDFALTPLNASAVAEICIRLDGLPLSIELAAARSKLLAPEAILRRLEHRLELLTGGARDLAPRQRTLRSTIDWSFNLLDADAQRLFSELAVFVGGCTPATTTAVCTDCGGEAAILDQLASLVDWSLVTRSEGVDGEPRFGMLETIREYAVEQLDASGDTDAVRRRHAEWCASLAERAESELRGAEQARWLQLLEIEHGNLRAALAFAGEREDRALQLGLAGSLWHFWYVHGHLVEGRRWLESALTGDRSERSALRAKALNGVVALSAVQGDTEQARRFAEEHLALCRALGDRRGTAGALGNLAIVVAELGDHGRARALNEECAALNRELGDRRGLAASCNNLGTLALISGEPGRARALFDEALALYRGVAYQQGIVISLLNLGFTELLAGDPDTAKQPLEESLRLARELGSREAIAYGLEGLAAVIAAADDAASAARVLGGAEALRESIGAAHEPQERELYEQIVATVRARLDTAVFADAWAAGRADNVEVLTATALGGEGRP